MRDSALFFLGFVAGAAFLGVWAWLAARKKQKRERQKQLEERKDSIGE